MSDIEWADEDDPKLREILGHALRAGYRYQDGRDSEAPALIAAQKLAFWMLFDPFPFTASGALNQGAQCCRRKRDDHKRRNQSLVPERPEVRGNTHDRGV